METRHTKIARYVDDMTKADIINSGLIMRCFNFLVAALHCHFHKGTPTKTRIE